MHMKLKGMETCEQKGSSWKVWKQMGIEWNITPVHILTILSWLGGPNMQIIKPSIAYMDRNRASLWCCHGGCEREKDAVS